MLDRSSYALSDFLLFSARVYYRMFALHNEALWPIQVLTFAFGAYLAVVILRPSHGRARAALALLALVWAFIGWSFFAERYASINWAAVYIAPFFAMQALILGLMAVFPSHAGLDRPRGVRRGVVLAVLMGALIGYPLVAVMLGRSWQTAEIFGIAPDPTVIATLAFLSIGRGMWVALAIVIPLAWVIMSTLTLYGLGAAECFLAPVAAVACWASYSGRRAADGPRVD